MKKNKELVPYNKRNYHKEQEHILYHKVSLETPTALAVHKIDSMHETYYISTPIP
jgi:hypothetical protein